MLLIVLTIICASFVGLVAFVRAGSLTPSDAPAATGYSLSAIYNRLVTNATTSAASHAIGPTTTVGATFHSLEDIYNAIPTIDATTVASGTAYLGVTGTGLLISGASSTITDLAAASGSITSTNGLVEWWMSDGTRATSTLDFPTISNVCLSDTSNNTSGTLSILAGSVVTGTTYCSVVGTATTGTADLQNMFNGGNGAASGGTQANGGVTNDVETDGNAYTGSWTDCTAGNSYCDTGLASADAMDNATDLIWSHGCDGVGCSSFSASTVTTSYTWDNSGSSNNSYTAVQLCTSGDHGESGWFLPHQVQVMQQYINNPGSNMTNLNNGFWTNTGFSGDPTNNLINYNPAQGTITNNPRNPAYEGWGGIDGVRCVRPAP